MQRVTVRDIMARHPVAIKKGTSLPQAVDTLVNHHLPGLPVVDDGNHVIGFISEQDCLGHLLEETYYDQGAPSVDDVMTRNAVTLEPNMLLIDLAQRVLRLRPKTFPVVEEDQLVGMVTRTHVVDALRRQRDNMDRKK